MVSGSTMLWWLWAEAALDHFHAAESAISRIQAQGDSASSTVNYPKVELLEAMQAIACAAFAVDTLRIRLHQVLANASALPQEPGSKQSRQERKKDSRSGIQEGASAALIIGAATTSAPAGLLENLTWLFEQRAALVHFSDESVKPLEPHPTLDMHVTREHATFSTHSAQRAIRTLLACLRACINAPSNSTCDWAEEAAGALTALEGQAADLGLSTDSP